jgi:hypothetical protein
VVSPQLWPDFEAESEEKRDSKIKEVGRCPPYVFDFTPKISPHAPFGWGVNLGFIKERRAGART